MFGNPHPPSGVYFIGELVHFRTAAAFDDAIIIRSLGPGFGTCTRDQVVCAELCSNHLSLKQGEKEMRSRKLNSTCSYTLNVWTLSRCWRETATQHLMSVCHNLLSIATYVWGHHVLLSLQVCTWNCYGTLGTHEAVSGLNKSSRITTIFTVHITYQMGLTNS